ncbi:GNAT family N-acetyltransferase [Streptomyces sp. NBC_01381]|uniref:GNAT family N-acetyltransferase n=1 Tax=Streptomyces sp. NBC_01381 TaxID=2903845 RepID=UPI0022512A4D|nr:GNAT family N-acetyltransferase [Streptomyces sp. NBC_01381]MCX4671155.1 GNAT family N-acetyltransferase [Streptomyces sp. NBC_01381]
MTAIGLRLATASDSEYCFQLHKAAMGAYVTAIWGWDEHVQRGFHARAFTPDRWQIITADGSEVGMLHVEHRPTEIYLARIELHPDHQGRGIGSQLIRSLLHQARLGMAQDLTLDVLAVNQRPGSLPATEPARGHSSQRERHQDQDVHQIASAWPDPQILTMTPQSASPMRDQDKELMICRRYAVPLGSSDRCSCA